MRGWEGLHQEKSKISVIKFNLFNLFNLAKAGVIMGRVLYRIADYTCIIFVIGIVIGAIVGAIGAIWGLYQLTQLIMVPIMGKWAYGLWGVVIFIGAMWRFINWASKYGEWQKEETLEALEALVSEALRLENEGLFNNSEAEVGAEAEVDVINPLTPEIRCSNCIYSSDYRGSLFGRF